MKVPARKPRRPESAGFTLLELVVSMGILAGFLVMLVQLLNSGVDLVEEGESGQVLTDRAQQAAADVREALAAMRGPAPGVEPHLPDARLWVQWVSPGLQSVPEGQEPAERLQVLRASVALEPRIEQLLRDPELQARAEQEAGDLGERAVAERLAELRATLPLVGRGSMWLLPWPAGDPEGAYLELRRGLFAEGALLESGQGEAVDPLHAPYLGPPEVPAALALSVTEPLVVDLLHFELRLWSQYTDRWDARPGSGGPEFAWDSARAGWLPEPPPLGFALDRSAASLQDPTDDVFPSWIRVTLVVGNGPGATPATLLAEDLGVDGRQVRVVNPDRLPEGEGMVKIGSEWVRYTGVDGYVLRGLQRGLRGTKAVPHPGGTGVRVGRQVEFDVALPHAAENWNG